MFEDICLHCAKPLRDDGYVLLPVSFVGHHPQHNASSRAYCSVECSNSALASPSVSSSSSALSSPCLGYAQGADVPPLVLPSLLGSALGKYKHDPYYVSSSSASSNSWGLATDDDEDESAYGPGIALRAEGMDSIYGSAKSANFTYPLMPSPALSYARRPSGTNTHSTVPQPSKRSSSGAPPSHRRHHVRGAPRSVPNPSSASTTSTDDSESSDELDSEKFSLKSTSSKRRHKRDSLPSYFSLLKISSPSSGSLKASPVLSSSGNTVAHLSPPTPKIIHPAPAPNALYDPSRGRRRFADQSRCSRRSDSSSPSRSRSRQMPSELPRGFRGHAMPERGLDVEPRGRSTLRRNSSPHAFDAERSRSSNFSNGTRGRGRVPVDELEGVGCLPEAPGFGNGRSGLLDRGRAGMAKRILPL